MPARPVSSGGHKVQTEPYFNRKDCTCSRLPLLAILDFIAATTAPDETKPATTRKKVMLCAVLPFYNVVGVCSRFG
jgi:hypothetical protein